MDRDVQSDLIIQILSDVVADLAHRIKCFQEEIAEHEGVESDLRLKNLLDRLKALNTPALK